MKNGHLKTHNYKILKTYTPEEIKAHGNVEFFLDPEVTDKKIKLRRAHILNKIGYNCCEDGCNLKDFYFGLGIDNGGGIHLDLYGIDQDGEDVMITIDHVKPKSKGGKDVIKNFRPMCKVHNEIKSNVHNFNRKFIDLTKIYTDAEMISQNYQIYKRKLTKEDIEALRGVGNFLSKKYIKYFVVGEEHVSLYKRGEGVMMSTHQTETMTNQDFINQAYGDVIIFGLGLGMIVFPLLNDKDVKSITVIEYDAGVIDMVGKVIEKYDTDKKLKIIQGDVFEYHKQLNLKQKFDTIYFDIWIKINEKAFDEMETLHDAYRKFMRADISYMHSWCYEFKDEYLKEM